MCVARARERSASRGRRTLLAMRAPVRFVSPLIVSTPSSRAATTSTSAAARPGAERLKTYSSV